MSGTVKDDGGSAFPEVTHIEAPNTIGHMVPKWSRVKSEGGMTLRDWFAGQALSAIATPHALKAVSDGGGYPSAVMAKTAYDIADSMLAERSKP